MQPINRGLVAKGTNSGGTTFTVTLPTELDDGDVLVFLSVQQVSNASTITHTTPAGWTLAHTQDLGVQSGTVVRTSFAIYTRAVNGSQGASVQGACTHNGSGTQMGGGYVGVYRGAAAAALVIGDVQATGAGATGTTAVAIPSMTSTVHGETRVMVALSTNQPAGFSETMFSHASMLNASPNTDTIAMTAGVWFEELLLAPGVQPQRNGTSSSSSTFHTISFGIKPAYSSPNRVLMLPDNFRNDKVRTTGVSSQISTIAGSHSPEIAVGDLDILTLCVLLGNPTITWPTGFVEFCKEKVGSHAATMACAYRVRGVTSPSTYTVSYGVPAYASLSLNEFRVPPTGWSIDSEFSIDDAGGATTFDLPPVSINPAVGGALLLHAGNVINSSVPTAGRVPEWGVLGWRGADFLSLTSLASHPTVAGSGTTYHATGDGSESWGFITIALSPPAVGGGFGAIPLG